MIASVRTATLAACAFLLGGCDLTDTGLRNGAALLPTIGVNAGQRIVPRQCAIKMAVIERPLAEDAFTTAIWSVADVQAASDEARRSWAANGMRLGLVTGDLPAEVVAVLDAPPPHQVNPATVILPDGDSTVVNLETHANELNVLLALQSRSTVEGKRYADVNGYLRLSGRQDGDSQVAVRVLPELHHGPIRQAWGVSSGGGTFDPKQLVYQNGQAEDTFRDLAAELKLRPGQVAVLGLEPGRKGSLGHFLFSTNEANSDRVVQKLLFVWAQPVAAGAAPGAPGRNAPPILQPVDPPAMPEALPGTTTTATTRRPARNHTAATKPGADLAMDD